MDVTKIATARAVAAESSITDLRNLAAGLEPERRASAENALDEALRNVQQISDGITNVVSGDREAAKAAAQQVEAAEKKLAEGAKIVVGSAPSNPETLQAVSTATAAIRDAASAVEATTFEGKTAGDVRPKTGRLTSILLVIFGVTYWLLWVNVLDSREKRGAAAITLVALTVGLTVLYVIGKGSFRPYLVGTDRRYSTSKVQVAAWTLIVVTMVGYLSLLMAFLVATDAEGFGLSMDQIGDYLILLGGPFAAGLLAWYSTATGVEKGEIQKTEAPSARPQQLGQQDNGRADLVDAQYLLFNLVAMGYVIVAFFSDGMGRLPSVPAVLLALTGASAMGYGATKALFKNPPTISSVSPLTVRPGEVVRIAGTNFRPDNGAGFEESQPVILLSDAAGELTPRPDSEPSELRVDIPIGIQPGLHDLRVRSTARVLTGPYQISVIADKPVVVGPTASELRGGQPMTLIGRYLLPANNDAPRVPVLVIIDGTATVADVEGIRGAQQRVSITLDPSLQGEHSVILRRGAVESDAITIRVLPPLP